MKFKRVLLLLAAAPSMFAAGIGGTLPWETPLNRISSSISGPVAVSIGIIAIAVGGFTVAFGHDFNEFARKGILIGMSVALIVAAAGFLTGLFGIAGAVV